MAAALANVLMGGQAMADKDLDIYNVQRALLAACPEVLGRIWIVFGGTYDLTKGTPEETPENYPVFEDVVAKLMFELLESRADDNLLGRLFLFFEDMANSPDRNVSRDLLNIAILEKLVYRKESLAKAWRFMGPELKALAVVVANEHGKTADLPPDYTKDVLPK